MTLVSPFDTLRVTSLVSGITNRTRDYGRTGGGCWTAEDSPWYPTMRLFRQPKPGDRQAVISKVVEELRKVLRTA
ncbi:MAG: hypothetical protein AB1638_09310 [Nitrospirota bacterium]